MEIRVTVILVFLLCFQTFSDSAEKEVMCKVPHIDNGFVKNEKVQLSEGTPIQIDKYIAVSCNEGYNRSSDEETEWILCKRDGHWHRNDRCIVSSCIVPPLQNGKFDHEEGLFVPIHNDVLVKSCNSGFRLVDKHKYYMRCQRNGTWDNTPMCINDDTENNIRCNVHALENGLYVSRTSHAYFGASIRAVCNRGYVIENTTSGDEIRCEQGGNWDRDIVCIGRQCKDENPPTNGRFNVTPSGLRYPASIRVVCNTGYERRPRVSNSLQCNVNGTWIGTTGVCQGKECKPIAAPSHVFFTPNSTRLQYPSSVTAACYTGYTLKEVTERILTCTTNGDWNGTHPGCQGVQCQTVDPPAHGTLNSSISVHRYPAKLSITCDVGYTLQQGSSGILGCGPDGMWSGPVPECQVVHVSAPSHSDVQTGKIAGIAIGVAIFVLSSIAVVVIFIRSRRDRDNSIDDNIENTERGKRNISRRTGKQRGMEMTGTGSAPLTKSDAIYANAAMETESSDYYSFDVTRLPKTAIRKNSFPDFVFDNQGSSDIMHAQFKAFPEGLQLTYQDAMTSRNIPKNRYKNIYPYDSTRVRLADIKGKPDSDFINASMIHGYSRVNAYIATQGPTCSTTVDFWRMIWERKASSIVMLTKLIELDKIKCHQYWPDNDSSNYGNVTVTLAKTEVWPDFTIRCFQLRKKQNNKVKTVAVVRNVRQFHFTAWPDKCVPKCASSLVHFWSKVRLEQDTGEEPIIVHCSAGIGRTGTFIALDWLVDQTTIVDFVDVNGCVTTLRRQRLNMVQTLEQYKFLHHSLVEALMLSTRVVHVSEFPSVVKELLENDVTGQRTRMEQEFELLRMIGIDSQSTGNDADGKQHLVQLTGLSRNSCNALWLSNYKGKNSFIVTQTPSQGSAANFWEMVLQHEVVTMVMLSNTPHEKEFWPEMCSPKKYGGIEVETTEVEAYSEYRTQKMVVRQGKKAVLVRQFQCMYWSDGQAVPSSPLPMLEQMQMVAAWQQAMFIKPVLVHCQDGVNRSGLYCVIASLIERLKSEHDVAISQAVDQLRTRKPDIIPNAEQFQFGHEALLAYIEKFEKASTDTENAIEKA